MMLFGRLTKQLFLSDNKDFAVYELRLHGREFHRAVFRSTNDGEIALPARKTVELRLTGSWQRHPKYGQQFVFSEAVRAELCTKPREDDIDVLLSAKSHPKMAL